MSGRDEFFHKERCDRCVAGLGARTMSWFTDETICMDCSDEEARTKKAMRAAGTDPSFYEGCGREQYEELKARFGTEGCLKVRAEEGGA